MKQNRIPNTIKLPFGYTIRVFIVSDADMLEAMDEDKRDKEQLADGLWDCEERVIRVRQALTLKRRRYVLTHEMQHATLDWQHHCLIERIAETT